MTNNIGEHMIDEQKKINVLEKAIKKLLRVFLERKRKKCRRYTAREELFDLGNESRISKYDIGISRRVHGLEYYVPQKKWRKWNYM